MGAFSRLVLALLLGGCAAMIYFGGERPARTHADMADDRPAQEETLITTSTLAPPDADAPLTRLYVSGTVAPLREGPSLAHTLVTELEPGSTAILLRDTGEGWVQVHAVQSGIKGYVPKSALSAEAPG